MARCGRRGGSPGAAGAGTWTAGQAGELDDEGGQESEHSPVDDGQPEPVEAEWELEEDEPGVLFCTQCGTNYIILLVL